MAVATEKAPAKESAGQKGLVRVIVTCSGVSPMLMNPMTEETLDSLITGVRPQLNKDRPFADVARDRIYLDDYGHVGIPIENLTAALREAGRNVKNGKKAISTATSTTLYSFCEFPGEFVPFEGQNGELPKMLAKRDPVPENELVWKVDKRRGVMKNGANSVAVGILRPKFYNWRFSVEVVLNEKIVTQDTLRKLFDEAGTNCGLGDFRPQKRGPFGRFKVTDWQVVQ